MARRRNSGRPEAWYTDPATGLTTVTFAGGAHRIYSRDEIAEHVVEVCALTVSNPGAVYEPWYEFLRDVVGEEMMVKTIAAVAQLA